MKKTLLNSRYIDRTPFSEEDVGVFCSSMYCRSRLVAFSAFPVNMETAKPPHGPPRGLVNRMIGLGLPPWAAWCANMNRYAIYRMSGSKRRALRPKYPQDLDQIWLNETVRERVRVSPRAYHVYRQLVYPWMKVGVWHSDILDHWVQVPHVQAALYSIEADGGIDNFIMKRPGAELQSKYGEKLRRHLLVRQKEIEKNFILDKQAAHLANSIMEDLKTAKGVDELDEVLAKYGISKEELRTYIKGRKTTDSKSMKSQLS